MKTGIFIGENKIEVLKDGKEIFSSPITSFPDDLKKALEKATKTPQKEEDNIVWIFEFKVENMKIFTNECGNKNDKYETKFDDKEAFEKYTGGNPLFVIKEYIANVLANLKVSYNLSWNEKPELFFQKLNKNLKNSGIIIKTKGEKIYKISIPEKFVDTFRVCARRIPYKKVLVEKKGK